MPTKGEITLLNMLVSQALPNEASPGFDSRQSDFISTMRGQLLSSVIDHSQKWTQDRTSPNEEELRNDNQSTITLARAVHGLDSYLYNRQWSYEGERQEEHQAEVLHSILEGLAEGHREGYDEQATSTGKSHAIAKLAEAFYLSGLRVLILSPKKRISTQLFGAEQDKGLAKFAPHIPVEKIGQHFDYKRGQPDDAVVISTYQSLINFSKSGELGEFDVMLCDEAHRGLGDVTSNSLKNFSPNSIKIGFSATPDYAVNKTVSEIFPYRYHHLSNREAIERSLTAPVRCLVYATGEKIRITDPHYYDFSERELARLRHLKTRNQKAVEFAHDFVEDGRQGLIACVPGADLAHAKSLAEQLSNTTITDKKTGKERLMRARAVGSGIVDSEEVMDAYERGEVDVLTFVNIISEGWDSNRASFLINACPTTSINKIGQLLGRIGRKKNNNLESIFVDFLDEAVTKKQQTSLHFLGELAIELGRVYGGNSSETGETKDTLGYLRHLLNADLYSRLAALDGMLLTDLTVTPKSEFEHRQAAYFERLLAREGLGSDPQHQMGIPSNRLADIDRACDEFLNEFRREPTRRELHAYMMEYPKEAGTQYTQSSIDNVYAYRKVDSADLLMNIADYVDGGIYDDPAIVTGTIMANHAAGDSLAYYHLVQRERVILKLRHGIPLGDDIDFIAQCPGKDFPEVQEFVKFDSPKTHDEIAILLGLTRERIRQLISHAFVKLRSSSKYDNGLHSLLDEHVEEGIRTKSEAERLRQHLADRNIYAGPPDPTKLPPTVTEEYVALLGLMAERKKARKHNILPLVGTESSIQAPYDQLSPEALAYYQEALDEEVRRWRIAASPQGSKLGEKFLALYGQAKGELNSYSYLAKYFNQQFEGALPRFFRTAKITDYIEQLVFLEQASKYLEVKSKAVQELIRVKAENERYMSSDYSPIIQGFLSELLILEQENPEKRLSEKAVLSVVKPDNSKVDEVRTETSELEEAAMILPKKSDAESFRASSQTGIVEADAPGQTEASIRQQLQSLNRKVSAHERIIDGYLPYVNSNESARKEVRRLRSAIAEMENSIELLYDQLDELADNNS